MNGRHVAGRFSLSVPNPSFFAAECCHSLQLRQTVAVSFGGAWQSPQESHARSGAGLSASATKDKKELLSPSSTFAKRRGEY
jgi:hypothetical protein